MLWLSRRRGERIIITTPEGRRIVIERGQRFGDKVRIGIEADREVVVVREELEQRNEATT